MIARLRKLQIPNWKSQIAIACVVGLMPVHVVCSETFSFNDIRFWVGSGANRAAMVIDWDEASPELPALAWGYQWDGAATGYDMLATIVATDPRLFAKLGRSVDNLVSVYGLGYDADNDGEFGIDDQTQFDAEGFAYSGPADLAQAIDPDDYYAEGWFGSFWHYGIASINPYDGGDWRDTGEGVIHRELADGAWDGWVYSRSFNFEAFPENPVAALSPLTIGDFDHDGRVDATDYQLWRSAFGSMSELAADGDANGIIDAADYVVWRHHLSTAAANDMLTTHQEVPELRTILLWAIGIIVLWLLGFRPIIGCSFAIPTCAERSRTQ